MRAVLRFVCLFSIIYSSQVAADPDGVVKWLMNEPLTLWDIGIIRIEQAAEKASVNLNLEHQDTAVHYVWDQNEIIVSFFGRRSEGHATHEKCNEIRLSIIGNMAKLSIRRIKMLPDSDSILQSLLVGAVSDWFSHKHFTTEERDNELGKKMANKIYIEVMVLGALGPKGVVESAIRCNEKIITMNALSQPISLDLANLYFLPPSERNVLVNQQAD